MRRWWHRCGGSGPYVVRLAGLPPGAGAIVRLFGDSVTTRRASRRHDEGLAVGIALGAGAHSGYRLDPTGGEPPGGGGDVEGCVVAQSGTWFSACLGLARQRFPDADRTVTWYFIEPRVTLWSGSLAGSARTEVGVSLRIAQGGETRPRNISRASSRPGSGVSETEASLYLVRPDGSGLRRISAEGRRYRSVGLDWSPDGERLVAVGDSTLELVRVASGGVLPLSWATLTGWPSWRP